MRKKIRLMIILSFFVLTGLQQALPAETKKKHKTEGKKTQDDSEIIRNLDFLELLDILDEEDIDFFENYEIVDEIKE